jgi:hypothetical protein
MFNWDESSEDFQTTPNPVLKLGIKEVIAGGDNKTTQDVQNSFSHYYYFEIGQIIL